MKNTYIIVKNIKSQDIQSILMELANLYSDTGYTDAIQLYQHNKAEDEYLVLFSNNPDFDRFSYFVNYIRYPEGFNNIDIDVVGYSSSDDTPGDFQTNSNSWLMYYVSAVDKEYDNVNLITDKNISFKFDFSGKLTVLEANERLFERKETSKDEYSIVMDIIPSKQAILRKAKPWWKIW